MVGMPHQFVEVMGDEERGFLELRHQRLELILPLQANKRVQRREELVHKKDFRVGGKCAGDATRCYTSPESSLGRRFTWRTRVDLPDPDNPIIQKFRL